MQKKSTTAAAYTRKLTSTKIDQIKPENLIKIKSSADSFAIAWSLWDLETIEVQEHFAILMLNRANKVIGWANIGIGGSASCAVDPKIVFSHALLCGAASIIAFHNHPSGEMKTSSADDVTTNKIKEGGKLLDICLLDHIILSPEGQYYSYADNGRI